MSDETPEAKVEDPEPSADEDASDDREDKDEVEGEVDSGNKSEPPSRPAARPEGLPRTTTTGDPALDVRQPGAGAVDEGDALDREREGEDVRGHPEDHGTLLPD